MIYARTNQRPRSNQEMVYDVSCARFLVVNAESFCIESWETLRDTCKAMGMHNETLTT